MSTHAATAPSHSSSALPSHGAARGDLYSRLNTEWMQLCARPSAAAEVLTWSVNQPALSQVQELNDLAGAHRLDRDAVLLALLTLHQEGSVLAGRALLQLMLGKLISLTRHARVAGFDSYHAYDERAATTIATFMSLIAEYRPSGENIYAALFLRTLKKIAHENTFAGEIPASDLMDRSDAPEAETENPFLAQDLLAWAVRNGVITGTDRALIQRAYLDQTDTDLTSIAAEIGMTSAALRQRLYRAVSKIRNSVGTSNQTSDHARFARASRSARPIEQAL